MCINGNRQNMPFTVPEILTLDTENVKNNPQEEKDIKKDFVKRIIINI
jgi:hypothetical protein